MIASEVFGYILKVYLLNACILLNVFKIVKNKIIIFLII